MQTNTRRYKQRSKCELLRVPVRRDATRSGNQVLDVKYVQPANWLKHNFSGYKLFTLFTHIQHTIYWSEFITRRRLHCTTHPITQVNGGAVPFIPGWLGLCPGRCTRRVRYSRTQSAKPCQFIRHMTARLTPLTVGSANIKGLGIKPAPSSFLALAKNGTTGSQI